MQTWTVSQIHGTSAIRACLVLTDPNSNAVLMKLVAALRQRLDISTIQIIQTNRAFVCRISATASRSTTHKLPLQNHSFQSVFDEFYLLDADLEPVHGS